MMTREFTDSEIRYLRSLRAVDTVTPTRIIYSSEFKKRFLREYLNGKSPSAIFRDAGLPNVIVGRKRIERCTARWAKDEREEHDTSLGAPDPDSEHVDMLLDETRKLVDDLSAALLRVERIIDMPSANTTKRRTGRARDAPAPPRMTPIAAEGFALG